jgi:O-antigen/teichoic acid export membrane protein
MSYQRSKVYVESIILNLFTGSLRTQTVKKNIIGSFAIKGLSILALLITIPLTIKLLSQEKYGIWITIYSIISWFNMMDLGLGLGFRNKFIEAIAINNKKVAIEYIQFLYSFMIIISFILIVLYSIASFFLSWGSILNLKQDFNESINIIMWVVFFMFSLQFFLKNISILLLALQKTSYSNFMMLIANIISLSFILILEKIKCANLFTISISFMISPILVYIFFTIYLFNTLLKEYKPKVKFLINKIYFDELFGIGLKFFVIQLTTVIMFSSANIIISQLFGPEEVTPYSIASRLFSSFQIFLSIIITPFWAAFSESNAKNDILWIKNSVNKLIKVWFIFSIGIIIIWIISPLIFNIWIGDGYKISYSLTFQFAIFTIIMGWLNPFVFYLNSVGKIKLELFIALLQTIITIPLAIYFAKNLSYGTIGVIMATNIVLLISVILMPIQYYKLINNKAKGIWNQ